MTTDRSRALDYASRHVDRIAEEVRTLQALLALRPGPELVDELRTWIDEHQETSNPHGCGPFMELTYNVRQGLWRVQVQLGDDLTHPKANATHWLETFSADLATAAAEMLSYLREVQP